MFFFLLFFCAVLISLSINQRIRTSNSYNQAGKIHSLGISNYGIHHLNELESYIQATDPDVTIDVGQWEIHPWLPREEIVAWCRKRNIAIEAYCPLVRGQRAEESALKEIAAKYGKTWAQVLVRWSLQKVCLVRGMVGMGVLMKLCLIGIYSSSEE